MSGHRTNQDMMDGIDQFSLADPGNAGVIQANSELFFNRIELSTAGAETRTLPDPVRGGQFLSISMAVDGGNAVITAATAVNAAGNTTLTFADVTDTITLISIPDGAGGYRWSVVGNDGVALS